MQAVRPRERERQGAACQTPGRRLRRPAGRPAPAPASRSARRRPRQVDRLQVGHTPPRSQPRSTRRRSAAGRAPTSRAGAAGAADEAAELGGGRGRRAVEVLPQHRRGAGERGRDTAAEHLLRAAQHLGAQPDARVGGVVVPGSSQTGSPCAAQAAGSSRAGRRAAAASRAGRTSTIGHRPRPDPRPRPSRTVSAWSSSVCPMRAPCSAAAGQRARSARTARPRSAVGADRTRTTRTGSRPRSRSRTAVPSARSAEPGCRPWSTVTPPTRTPASRRLEGERRRPARGVRSPAAGDEHRLRRTQAAPPDGASARPRPAAGRPCVRPGQAGMAGRPSTRSTQSAGAVSSSIRGRFAGPPTRG